MNHGSRLDIRTRLPAELIDQFGKPIGRFVRNQAAAGGILFCATLAAVAISNSPWHTQTQAFWDQSVGLQIGDTDLTRTLRGWINSGLLTLFFFVGALELKRELVLGELRRPRIAALSLAGGLGGMLVPALLYLALQYGSPAQPGWGIVMSSDTAFVIGCLALAGSRIPQSLRVFMLSLSIVDDLGAILVVTFGYSSRIEWAPVLVSIVGLSMIRVLASMGVRSLAIYVLGGVMVWIALDASGIQPTITGVLLGLMTPARRWVSDERLYRILGQVVAHPTADEGSGDTPDRHTLQIAAVAAREALSPVERLEILLHPWVAFAILPLFALANAGLPLSGQAIDGSLALAVAAGFVLGKPTGVLMFCWLAVRVGIATTPAGLNWRLIAGGSLLTGIGFTMALFIADIALEPGLLNSAKVGVFGASAFCAISGLAVLMRTSRRVYPDSPDPA